MRERQLSAIFERPGYGALDAGNVGKYSKMTALEQITALVDAHVKQDNGRFRAITLQIAAHVAGRSERGADQLRKLVEHQKGVSFVPLSSASGLLSAPSDMSSLDDMVLAPSVRDRLDRVLLEYTQREILLVHSLRPARKLLFTGPPGVGKTMTAGAIARAVGLPMFRVELHGVISQHLGETANKLAKVFEHVRTMPAVYLFDEFDALGAERSTNNGSSAGTEMRRVVNSILQFIEDDRSDGFIIAATNHPQALDRALFRRFDEAVAFPALAKAEVVGLVDRALSGFDTGILDYDAIFAASPSLGHSDLCSVLDRTCKDHVIAGIPIDTRRVVEGIRRRMEVVA